MKGKGGENLIPLRQNYKINYRRGASEKGVCLPPKREGIRGVK